jgi:hypothetical protein
MEPAIIRQLLSSLLILGPLLVATAQPWECGSEQGALPIRFKRGRGRGD